MEQSKKQECIELIKMIYRHEAAGGLLHIVLDDGNVEDDYVNYCVAAVSSRAEKDGEEYVWFHLVEMACIMLISMMDEAERTEVIEQAWKEMRYESSVIDLSKAISKRLKIDKNAKVDVRETMVTLTEGADHGADT